MKTYKGILENGEIKLGIHSASEKQCRKLFQYYHVSGIKGHKVTIAPIVQSDKAYIKSDGVYIGIATV
jgi:hypothetical protein